MLARCPCSRLVHSFLLVQTRYASHSTTLSSNATRAPRTSPSVNLALAAKVKRLALHPRNASDPTADVFNSTLVRIKQALKEKDAHIVLEYWKYLKDKNLLHFLGSSQLEPMSRLILTAFVPARQSTQSAKPWSPMEQELVEDVAVVAAAGRSPELLTSTILFHIQQGNPQAAIDLYSKFRKLEVQAGRDNPAFSNDTKLLAPTPVPPSLARLPPLLAVIAAYAKLNSFQGAMKTYLEHPLPLNTLATRKFSANLAFDPALQSQVAAWIKRFDVARWVSQPPMLSRHVARCAHTRNLNRLQQLYQGILSGITGPDAYIAADVSQQTETKFMSMTETCWSAFLVGFLQCLEKNHAAQVWDDMTSLGVQPGVSTWTALLDTYGHLGAVDEALSAWDMMHNQGVNPDGLTYRALISILFNARKPDDAMQIFRMFQDNLQKTCKPDQLLSVYNTVLNGLLLVGRYEAASTVLEMMRSGSPKPDIISYNTFLAYHARRLNFKALALVIEDMVAAGMRADVFSFSTILSALLKAGREDAPEMILRLMRKQGVQPNVTIFSAIIDQQMREGGEHNLRAVTKMLDEMEKDPDLKPNEVTYTSILMGWYRGHWLDSKQAEEWRKDIARRMEEADIKFTLPAYHTLLKACLNYPHPEGLDAALAYYREMQERRMPFTQLTWYILLAGLILRDEWSLANEMVGEMQKSKVQVNKQIMKLVDSIRKGPARMHNSQPAEYVQ
ncbi:hypothetical protein AX16_006450 [Volvariella volvacea WC 439]|nr:hypothetical protein AX16_006450 [Volvariella volvacea WC 439]